METVALGIERGNSKTEYDFHDQCKFKTVKLIDILNIML